MNAPVLNIENIEAYSEMLPEGFVEETRKRQKLLHKNRQEARVSLDAVDRSCDSMATEFVSLKESFIKTTGSYARLESVNRTNHTAYSNLKEQLRELSHQLKMCGQSIRQSSFVR